MVRPADEEENKERFSQDGTPGKLLTAAGATSGGGPSSGGQPPGAGTQARGSGFVNASDYLAANQGKGLQLGQSITEGAKTPGNDLSAGYKGAENLSITGLPSDKAERESFKDLLRSDQDDPNAYAGFKSYLDRGGGKKIEVGGYDEDTLQRKLDSLRGLRSSVSQYDKAFEDTETGKNMRSQLLRDKADEARKAGKLQNYDQNAQAFDTMFMEAESPDVIQRQSQALKSLLNTYSTDKIDALGAEKLKALQGARSEADKMNADIEQINANYKDAQQKAAEAAAEAERLRQLEANKKKDETTTQTKSREVKLPGGSSGVDVSTSERTTHPDGSYEVHDQGTGATIYYDKNGNITRVEDPQGAFD